MKKTLPFLLVLSCLILACKQSEASSASWREEVFSGFNEIVLIVSGDDAEWMKLALECHDKEEQCADEYISRIPEYMRTTSESRDQYLKRIKQDYKDFPQPLHKEILRPLLSNMIQEEISPNIVPIVTAEIDAEKYSQKTDTLIVLAKLYIHKDIIPRMASITLSFYRPNISKTATLQSLYLTRTAIIPLNSPNEDIEKIIKEMVRGLSLNFVEKSH